ncbi:MAG: GAF domain-containing protein [Actinobacteria bacterium]|nr:GAF domain-containing protein [Actinomycetota bacterium]
MAGRKGLAEPDARPDEIARTAGINRRKLSLSEVDKRRVQLWAISIFLVAAITVAIALYTLGSDVLPVSLDFQDLTTWIVLVLVGGLALAFLVYVIEKELSLRKLTRLLIEERILSTALSNRISEISALSELVKSVNATLELDDVFRLILTSALELLGGNEGSIMLLKEDTKQLEVVSYQGPPIEPLIHGKTDLGEGIAGGVAETREPMLIQDYDVPKLGLPHHPERGIYSSMCVPLIRYDELVGVLNLNETDGRRRFSEEDLRALGFFAEHAAIAIGNAKLFEQERETIARLEDLDRLKSDFVATVSHELKTPLTAIIGSAQTLTRRRERMNPEQQANMVTMIERQGNRLLRLVEDVLTAARIESGMPRMRRELIDLKDLCEFVVESIRHSDIAEGREIVIQTEPENPQVWGDVGAIQQIVSNLVENACKYSEPKTKVGVFVTDLPEEAVIQVADQGYGMSEEEVATIFDRFRQVDQSSTRASGGVGLGLYIVKSLVEAHNGSIDVDSSPGRGTTFSVRFPKRAR